MPRARRSAGRFAAVCLVLAACMTLPASAVRDPRLDWWREARFGMFIHWGLYAVPAGEWHGRTDHGEWIRNNAQIPLDVYDQFRARFNPVTFDADAWVAHGQGRRHEVPRHHDASTTTASRCSTRSRPTSTSWRRRSAGTSCKELAEACRRQGIRIGFYHSIMDWHHPDYLPRRDWEKDRPAAGADFERYVALHEGAAARSCSPTTARSTCCGSTGVGGHLDRRARARPVRLRALAAAEHHHQQPVGPGRRAATSARPEQEIPATGVPGVDWETCMTMNDNWGYNRADKNLKSTAELVRNARRHRVARAATSCSTSGPTRRAASRPRASSGSTAIGALDEAQRRRRSTGRSRARSRRSPGAVPPAGRAGRRDPALPARVRLAGRRPPRRGRPPEHGAAGVRAGRRR